MAAPEELFDWMVNANCVRGSRLNDHGIWLSGSAKPCRWDPETRLVELTDGKRYKLNKEHASKALNLDRKSETALAALSIES